MNSNKNAICYCFDRNYAKYCQVSTISLIINSGTNYNIYCIHTNDVSDHDLQMIADISEKFKIHIKLIQIQNTEINTFQPWDRFTNAVYMRFLIPDLLPQIEKILYLDCDTIIEKDIQKIFDIDLTLYKYAGVIDEIATQRSLLDKHIRDRYINTGVMLMNLKELRSDNSLTKIIDLHQKNRTKLIWIDQCLINLYGHNETHLIDSSYNFQIFSESLSKLKWLTIKDRVKIFHFVGSTKPWHSWCREHLFDFWWSYAKKINNPEITPISPTRISEYILKFKALEEYDKFKDSAKLKEILISALIKNSHKNSK